MSDSILKNKPATIRQMLRASALKYKNNTAFIIKNERDEASAITYDTFLKNTDALAVALINDLKLKGKKIGICGKNSYWWCLSYMAIMSGAGIVVPIDKELSGNEFASIINTGRLDAVICDSEAAEKFYESLRLMQKPPLIILSESGNYNNAVLLSELIESGERLLADGTALPDENEISPSAVAVLLFTSGTTGTAKGVMLSNDNLCSDLAAVCDSVEITEQDVSLSVLPLHHTYEAISFLMVIFKGGCICFCPNFRQLTRCFQQYRPTVFVCVPLILEKIHKRIISNIEKEGKKHLTQLLSLLSPAISEKKRKSIFSDIHYFFGGRLDKIIVGAAALRKNVAENFELFGFRVIIGYGLTECSPIVICNSDTERTPDSVGKPVKGAEAVIVNADENGIGEIHVRGPMVMTGYYNNPEETEKVLKNGWFNTGDLGFIDEKGNFHITGRSKNIIVTATGKNIYPEELEQILMKSPLIKECLVYSPDDSIITAEVLCDEAELKHHLKSNSPTENEIYSAVNDFIRGVNRKLPSYKRIKQLIIRKNEFTKTSSHKIKRNN